MNRLVSLTFFFTILCWVESHAQCWPRLEKLIPEVDTVLSENFGNEIAMEGNIAVVGASYSDSLAYRGGIVYVFEYSGSSWKKIANLYPSDYSSNRYFGEYIKISGNTIVVGNPSRNEGNLHGAIYIFEKPAAGWRDMTETYRLLPPADPNVIWSFGYAVDLRGDFLIVGMPGTMTPSYDFIGGAIIYQRTGSTWTSVARLNNLPGYEGDFGNRVAMHDNYAVVTSTQETHGSDFEYGVTYVFNKPASGWVDSYPSARLTVRIPERLDGGASGASLTVDENTILVTDNRFNDGTFYGPALYLYEKPSGGWVDASQTSYYYDKDAGYYSTYDLPVLLKDDYAFFSGNGVDIKVFKEDPVTHWDYLQPVAKITTPNKKRDARFGSGAGINEDQILVSMPCVIFPSPGSYEPIEPVVFHFSKPAGGWEKSISIETGTFKHLRTTGSGSGFGTKVATDGNYAVVGAFGDKSNGISSGVAYVFEFDGSRWNRIAQLSPSDGLPYDNFGSTVAIHGDYIVVGAPFKERLNSQGNVAVYSEGAAYLYKKPAGGWKNMTETFKIVEPGLVPSPQCFGRSVAIEYPYIAVGQYGDDSSEDLGNVIVYKINGNICSRIARLVPDGQDPGQGYGMKVMMKNNVIAVGGRALRAGFFQSDAVYVFQKSEYEDWSDSYQSATLTPSPGIFSAGLFGFEVHVGEDAIIVGAPGATDNTKIFKGAAFVFDRPATGWSGVLTQQAILHSADDIEYNIGGGSVFINERFAAVGAPRNLITTYGGQNPGTGKVYFYQRPAGGWKDALPDKTITGDDNNVDFFGSSIAAVHGYLLIGSFYDNNQTGNDAGSVYVYTEFPFIEQTASPVCSNGPPITLKAYPPGGVWTGSGITDPVNGIFDSSQAIQRNRISYKVDGCDAANTIVIRLEYPVLPFTINDKDSIFFCGTDSVKLRANIFGTGLICNWSHTPELPTFSAIDGVGNVIEYYAKQPGYYRLAVSNICSVEQDTIWVGDLEVNAGNDFETCIDGDPISLVAFPQDGVWSGAAISGTDFFPTALGSYELVYSVSPQPGCFYRDTIVVDVKGTIVPISITTTDKFCYQGFEDLFATPIPGASYQWYFSSDGSSFSALSDANPYRATQRGYYKVEVATDVCSETSSVHETVPEFEPHYEPVGEIKLCYLTDVTGTVDAFPDATYRWLIKMPDGTFADVPGDGSTHTYLFTQSGTYKVEVENFGCLFSSPETNYTRIAPDSIFIPNVVTANGDGANDIMEIAVLEGEINSFELMVFNRYGKQVHQTNSLTWNPQGVSGGVYFWTVGYFSHCLQSMVYRKGTVSILKSD